MEAPNSASETGYFSAEHELKSSAVMSRETSADLSASTSDCSEKDDRSQAAEISDAESCDRGTLDVDGPAAEDEEAEACVTAEQEISVTQPWERLPMWIRLDGGLLVTTSKPGLRVADGDWSTLTADGGVTYSRSLLLLARRLCQPPRLSDGGPDEDEVIVDGAPEMPFACEAALAAALADDAPPPGLWPPGGSATWRHVGGGSSLPQQEVEDAEQLAAAALAILQTVGCGPPAPMPDFSKRHQGEAGKGSKAKRKAAPTFALRKDAPEFVPTAAPTKAEAEEEAARGGGASSGSAGAAALSRDAPEFVPAALNKDAPEFVPDALRAVECVLPALSDRPTRVPRSARARRGSPEVCSGELGGPPGVFVPQGGLFVPPTSAPRKQEAVEESPPKAPPVWVFGINDQLELPAKAPPGRESAAAAVRRAPCARQA